MRGATYAVLLLPAIGAPGLSWRSSPIIIAAEALTVICFFIGTRVDRRLMPAFFGAAIVCFDAWLLHSASAPGSALLVAPSLGVGLGLVAGKGRLRLDIWAIAVAIVLLTAGRIFLGRDAALFGACLLTLAAFMTVPLPAWRVDRATAGVTVLATLLALAAFASIGATTPRATWFGGLTYRGPAEGHMVALTFDDGPNDPYTLEVASILDRYGVKGTFFTVGKALDARPDISQALIDDGHLLGNHSYHHDSVSWLSPGYGEARDTQAAFKRDLKVCPAFFRPPHGTHTPFMSHTVHDQGMRVVNWDVSAADWATRDGALVARRVLKDARPGSIILLHDGLDGDVTSDRSVLLTALPLIIDGLKDRGLRPVGLDELLGGPAYTDCPK